MMSKSILMMEKTQVREEGKEGSIAIKQKVRQSGNQSGVEEGKT